MGVDLRYRQDHLHHVVRYPPTSTGERIHGSSAALSCRTNIRGSIRGITFGSCGWTSRSIPLPVEAVHYRQAKQAANLSPRSLPLGTANYPLPKRPLIDGQGQIFPKAFLYHLADNAASVLDLDNMAISGRSRTEIFNAVVSVDQELRSLASRMPKTWWRVHWPELCIDIPLQFWYTYLLARTHLQLALMHSDRQPFAFSFLACVEATQELARRYTAMRALYPKGLFITGVLDLQALTAITFLLLTSHRAAHDSSMSSHMIDANLATSLADQATHTMEIAASEASGAFAQRAIEAVRSLRAMLRQSQTTESHRFTLSLPLVGKIHISRNPDTTRMNPRPADAASSQAPPGFAATAGIHDSSVPDTDPMVVAPSDSDSMDILSYTMEIPENMSFLTDDNFGTGQWYSFNGFNSGG
jgi:hypothetical protein